MICTSAPPLHGQTSAPRRFRNDFSAVADDGTARENVGRRPQPAELAERGVETLRRLGSG
jgi:hypothetical protein